MKQRFAAGLLLGAGLALFGANKKAGPGAAVASAGAALAGSVASAGGAGEGGAARPRPRVIVMTDGEVDDRSSMARFLHYTGDVDVAAIIEANSMFQLSGHSGEDWLEKQLVEAAHSGEPTLKGYQRVIVTVEP